MAKRTIKSSVAGTEQSSFQFFAKVLQSEIAKYPEKNSTELQKRQLETLVDLEDQFRLELQASPWGYETYERFINWVRDERGNILAARTFWRVRTPRFVGPITEALKERNPEKLYPHPFNYMFVVWVLKQRDWSVCWPKLIELKEKIEKMRIEIAVLNLPLGISRARMFYSRTPKSQLSYLDLIQTSCEGLLAAIDKFVLPFTPVWRSVAIGRMTGRFINDYSKPIIHFFPLDRKRLYRANKMMRSFEGHVDWEELANYINSQEKDPKLYTNALEMAELVAAASSVSADSALPSDPEGGESIERFAAPDEVRPDVQLEAVDLKLKLGEALKFLTVFERKILRLKGVDKA